MSKVSDGDTVFFVDVGDEWTFVIHLEGEDAMLVWNSEGGGVGG